MSKFDQTGRGRKNRGRKGRRREKEREAPPPGDPIVGVRRSRRKSRSPQRELCVGTEIREFRQVPRDRGFYSTLFNSCLRVIQMIEIVGGRTAVHFSPKIWN